MGNDQNFGILTFVDWNSNKWQDKPTDEDIAEVKIKDTAYYSALNFNYSDNGDDKLKIYPGYLAQLADPTPKSTELKSLNIIFIYSKEPGTEKNVITGLLAFPTLTPTASQSPFGEIPVMKANYKCIGSHIHRLENYFDMNQLDKKQVPNFRHPKGKRKYFYLNKQQIEKILDSLTQANPDDSRLHGIKFKLIKSMMN